MPEDIHKELIENGFVVIDLLTADEVGFLNRLCEKYLSAGAGGDFISSSHFLKGEDSVFINQELHKILQPKISVLFPELEMLGGTLATKRKGKAILKAHNDWSIVDETVFSSYNLWIALVDTSEKNGTLEVVPSSHKWKHPLRGYGLEEIYEPLTKKIMSISVAPALQAGKAILYNHRLVHLSKANNTETPRNVAIVGLKDKQAELRVSFCTDKKTVETYQVNEEDFYKFDINKIRNERELISKNAINYNEYENIANAKINSILKEKKLKEPFVKRVIGFLFK